MPRTLTLAAFAALCTLALTCKKEPPVVPPGTKDPRTYTWTIDTITYPGSFQTAMRGIWASGPDNAYIVGHNDRAFGKMFRYDGRAWTDVKLNQSQGGTIAPPVDELSRIHGFGPNNIYAVGGRFGDPPAYGDSSVIIHFDGTQWREQPIVPRRGRLLQSLWGASPTDIWAGGVNTLLHYNGVQWSHFPIEMPGQGIQFFSMTGLSSSEVYMMGWRPDVTPPNDTTAYLLYRFDGSSWSVVDSIVQVLGFPPARFGVVLGNVANEVYSLSASVYRMISPTWELLLTTSGPFNGISGTRRDNFFVVGLRTQIIHYDGRDAYSFQQFPSSSIDFYSVWTNENEVFVVGNDGYRTFVARGK